MRTSLLTAAALSVATLLLTTTCPRAQTITPRNLAGGCGGTLGYPAIQSLGNLLVFRVQRSACDPNSFSSPSVVAVGLRTTDLPIPLGPGVPAGCTWRVVPEVVLLLPSTAGGTGTNVRLGDPTAVPPGTVLYLQALITCQSSGGREHAASDAWELSFR